MPQSLAQVCGLRSINVFLYVCVQKIAIKCTIENVSDGDVICEKGEDAVFAYGVLEGAISLYRDCRESLYRSSKVASIVKGGMVGEVAVLMGGQYAVTAKVKGEAKLLKLPKDVLCGV